MMKFIENLHIPLCQPQRIPVKTLIEQLETTSLDKRLIEKHIATIRLISILDENSIRIRSYKDENYSYQSIYVLYIELKKDDSMTTLSNVVHSVFPEPTLLVYKYKEIYYISTANKRINKIDAERSVVEEIALAKILATIDISCLNLEDINGTNLKDYYENLMNWVYKLKVFQVTNVFPQIEADFKTLIKEYDSLIQEINKLKEEYKSASMVSEKMKIDDSIYSKEESVKRLIDQLKGEEQNG